MMTAAAGCRPWRRDMLPNPVDLQVAGTVSLAQALEIAKTQAQTLKPGAMLLAWFAGATGEYSPKIQG